MVTRRAPVVAVTLLALLAPSGCGSHDDRGDAASPAIRPVSGRTIDDQPVDRTQIDCHTLRQHLRRDGEVNDFGTHGRRLAVIGDSYTEGIGVQSRTRRWVARLAKLLPARVRADGIGSTGFVNPGPCGGQAYGTRTSHAGGEPTVLLEGGLNDLKAPTSLIVDRAVSLARTFPRARVVIIGPVDAPVPHGERRVDTALRDAARIAGVQYLSMLGLDPPFLPEGIHMTPAGHDEFARRVADFLSRRPS